MSSIAFRFPAAALFAVSIASASLAWGADVDRGHALYDEHCGECHTTNAHARDSRVAGDFRQIRQWVERWNANLALRWSESEITDVTLYLNNAYYRYPCPADVCPVIGKATVTRP